MKRLLLIFICMLSLLSCDKQVVNNKAIDGQWTIADFTLVDYNGIKQKPVCEGTCELTKDGKKSNSGKYRMDLHFSYNGEPASYSETGTYVFKTNNELTFTEDTSHVETAVTLVYKTKEDLVLEIPNKAFLGYYLVFKRVK